MRPPRIVILVAFSFTALLLTYLSVRSSNSPEAVTTTSNTSRRAGFRAFFSTPFSLFPPNAIITLTHDNTTAFLARPAAFGPLLPQDGLKGQVWIGSGFGNDGAEGELGCSDVPGWGESNIKPVPDEQSGGKSKDVKSSDRASVGERATDEDGPADKAEDTSKAKADGKKPSSDDGTDDYLHHPLPESKVTNPSDKHATEPTSNHADIQSIQESAEIAGKIVLLSRGGCGFLEKVKWAQRRGALALIVGDDTTGGPLIQMYARGDTSNVSIPAVFTSRTTAHLLSSLMGPGSFIEDTLDENGNPVLKVQHMGKSKKSAKKHSARGSSPKMARATGNNRGASRGSSNKKSSTKGNKPAPITKDNRGWFSRLIFGSGPGDSKSDSSRPPSSGQLDWVLVDDWRDEDDVKSKASKPDQKANKASSGSKSESANKQAASDDFVIGVQDWRDPDLVGSAPANEKDSKLSTKTKDKSGATKPKNSSPLPTKDGKKQTGGASSGIPENIPPLRGGSITPGSGEYNERQPAQDQTAGTGGSDDSGSNGGKLKGLLNAVFGDDEDEPEMQGTSNSEDSNTGSLNKGRPDTLNNEDEEEGLWVTLTPTSGASPFLDTLLVLVVSPLVTLTIVYTLLLVRSRIRRRRWRAPKSIVDRLPVRTYQTIRSGTQTPRQPSPSSASPTTPLLQSSQSRPRPRSRTTTGIPEPGDIARVNSNPLEVPGSSSRAPEHEKSSSVSSEWKKYMGRQVECVVCLEEYIPGVSRVMSLPCGHEFHVDCITPWLITRRRTCPICKGDVVRSLARGSPSSPRYEPYQDDSDDDIEAQVTAALPIPGIDSEESSADRERPVSPTPSRSRRNISGDFCSRFVYRGGWQVALHSATTKLPPDFTREPDQGRRSTTVLISARRYMTMTQIVYGTFGALEAGRQGEKAEGVLQQEAQRRKFARWIPYFLITITAFLSIAFLLRYQFLGISTSPARISAVSSLAPGIPEFVLDYAPLVWLDRAEIYFPSDLTAHIDNTTPNINATSILNPPDQLTLENLDRLNEYGDNGTNVYLTSNLDVTTKPNWLYGEVPDSTGATKGATSSVVIITDHGSGAIDVFYMYFYSYNRGNTVFARELGNHIGDWEHNMVRFINGTPTAVWFSQHGFGQAFTYDAVEKKGKRPLSYSARGSHANYAIPGIHDHLIPDHNLPGGFLLDYTSPGKQWDPIQNAYFYSYHPDNWTFSSTGERESPLGAMHFRGQWGDEQYSRSDSRQDFFFGFYKFVSGPTGPWTKDLNRTEVCPMSPFSCTVRDELAP
ncbi:hypothetical protein B7463_g2316, partial [Scytalidium lignicola]